MAFSLDKVVPWGRCFDEYVKMFSLTEKDIRRSILSCADGPADFNSVMRGMGHKVISVDPIYRYTPQDIKRRIDESYHMVMDQLERNRHDFIWENFTSPREVGEVRMKAMRAFLDDLEDGKREGRYLDEGLPRLSFADDEFELALCSHFLFLYSGEFSLDFHYEAVKEMLRVASEVRVFPLLDLGCRESPYLHTLVERLEGDGRSVFLEKVDYEFQKGGNTMLRVR